MENEDKTKLENQLEELLTPFPIETFDPSLMDADSVKQMLLAHQLKYVEHVIQAEEENKLADINMADFAKYSPEVQARAIEIAHAAKYDPSYYEKNANIDKDLFMPIQLVGVIEGKKDEAKIKTWNVNYHARLIERLRNFLTLVTDLENEENEMRYDNSPVERPQNWIEKIFG